MHRASFAYTLRLSAILALATACSSQRSSTPEPEPDPDPEPAGPRQTRFVSADARAGQAGEPGPADAQNAGAESATTPAADASGASARSVEEGDIYRVLDNGTILNLNGYRGLQVIDVADPSAPRIVGSYSVQGDPVEMYVIGNRALLLLNNWQGYYGSRDDVAVELREGGIVVAVDLSRPTAPRAVDSVLVEGWIRRSRVVRNDSVGALYIASSASREVQNDQGYSEWIERTVVTSFSIGGERLDRMSELDLGGYVSDIQATPSALLVASQDWSRNDERSQVAVVDISDPEGAMVLGDSVRVSGYVASQFNMDLHNGVLRVVSGSTWNGGGNTLETFDANDLQELAPLASCSFGADQQLYATLFLENKAFFVTYLRQDPFHAFEVRDDGTCIEHNEFVVSGWNDFFRPVAGGTRLIGIGQNDENGNRTPAVSLYDITDLANENPLLQRADGPPLQWSWSEASWDHRAFSVLEGAVEVATEGPTETGLVLLPYSGESYDEDAQGRTWSYFSGVQLFTFSESTVTARGVLDHDSQVRRAFLADEDVAAALSEQSLSLFDHSDPDAPELLGEVALAPDYARVFEFGDHVARLARPSFGYFWYEAEVGQELPSAAIEITARDADPNTTEVLASFDVPADARLLKAGDLLVSLTYRVRGSQDRWPYDYDTTATLYDLSDPEHPVELGQAETDALTPSYLSYGYGYYGGPAIGCGLGGFWFSGNQVDGTFALDDSIVFTTAREHRESVGEERVCSFYSRGDYCESGDCARVLTGGRDCRSLDGGTEICSGELFECTVVDHAYDCDPVAFEEVESELMRHCYDHERERYWTSYDFTVLDIRDRDNPTFGDTIAMPSRDEAVRVLPQGDSIYYTYKRPVEIEGDARPHVAYHFKQIDFSDPDAPEIADPVNIPGELIALEGDRIYTRDVRWEEERAETFVHELVLQDQDGERVAALEASHGFAGRDVRNVVVTDGNLLISHQPTYINYYYPGYGEAEEETTILSILAQEGLDVRAEVEVDRWSTLEAAHEGRALYTVPGGLLIVNVENAERPFAQAFFHSNGWPEQILFEGGDITVAAGRYGIYRFDVTEWNLLTE